jgi:hypothetical protein
MGMGAVTIHDVQLRRLVAQVLVVEADIGDVLAIRGNRGALIGAATIGQRVQRVVREIDAIDFAVQGLEIRIGAPVLRDQDGLAVGHEHRRALDIEVTVSELACRTAVGGHHEELAVRVGQISLAVDAEHHAIDEFGWIRPLRTLGRVEQVHLQRLVLGGHRHGEGQPVPIRRPGGR